MRLVYLVLSLITIMYAQNEIDIFFKSENFYNPQCTFNLTTRSENNMDILWNHRYVPDFFIAGSDQSYMDNLSIKSLQKSAWSDSSKKKSRVERSLERKKRRLQELADRYTVEELQQRIQNYKKSKTSGTILLSIGIPIFSAGLVATFVGLNNVDRSDSDGDEGWVVTALVGEIFATVGGILTAYGIIKSAKASSREKKFKELLKVKTQEIGIKIDQKGLSLCYQF